MKQTLNIGIIGVGNIGSAHAASIHDGKVQGMRLAALCDVDEDRREVLHRAFPNIPLFSSHKQLLESGLCDAVIIATPHYFHPTIAIDAFEKGLHVLTEKPAGVACLDVRKMMCAAEKKQKIFAIMFNQRTNKLFRRAKALVEGGELGELRRAVWIITNWYRKDCYYASGSWRATWDGEGGGVLLNQAPHNLDLLQWIVGMPQSVYAVCTEGKHHAIEVEDDATLLMRYENGAEAVFITSTGEYPGTNRLEITGTGGKLVIENGVLTFTKNEIDERDFRRTAEPQKNPLTVSNEYDEKYNGHINILENFAHAILDGEPLIAPGKEGIRELTLSNAAYLSAWLERPVTLPMDDALYAEMLAKKAQSTSRTADKEARESLQSSYKDRWNTSW